MNHNSRHKYIGVETNIEWTSLSSIACI